MHVLCNSIHLDPMVKPWGDNGDKKIPAGAGIFINAVNINSGHR